MANMINEINTNLCSKIINNKVILITGGTGSFGNKMSKIILDNFKPKKLIIFSRDEFKQYNMKKKFPLSKYPNIRFFIGDIRDPKRLDYAFKDVDIVFHAAALKQVPALEYNPTEAVKTNIYGGQNVIDASIKNNVKYVMAISTDKATSPINLYGATKMCMERLFISANYLSGDSGTIFSVARYGNVFGSRGSVIPLFIKQRKTGILTITDERMTRFTLTLDSAINFVLNCLTMMVGGEIFIPKIPSYNIVQLANIIGPNCEKKIIGIRPGEKLHEAMIDKGESHMVYDCKSFYIITPYIKDLLNIDYEKEYSKFMPKKVKDGFSYTSGNNELIDDNILDFLIKEYIEIY